MTITPERVAAEAVTFDAQDRAVVAGQVVLDFAPTGVLAAMLAPREWEEVAAYLFALAEREPVKRSPAYSAHRIVLGSLASDLRSYARMAGEPVGLEADLRAATSQAEERRIRERIDDQQRALERHLDDIALQQSVQHHAPDPVGEEAWTRHSGDWVADAAAEADHDRHHDHSVDEEAPIDVRQPGDNDELPAFLR